MKSLLLFFPVYTNTDTWEQSPLTPTLVIKTSTKFYTYTTGKSVCSAEIYTYPVAISIKLNNSNIWTFKSQAGCHFPASKQIELTGPTRNSYQIYEHMDWSRRFFLGSRDKKQPKVVIYSIPVSAVSPDYRKIKQHRNHLFPSVHTCTADHWYVYTAINTFGDTATESSHACV